MPERNKQYTLSSGRRVTVLEVRDGLVTYKVDGLRTMMPLTKTVDEFLVMVGIKSRAA